MATTPSAHPGGTLVEGAEGAVEMAVAMAAARAPHAGLAVLVAQVAAVVVAEAAVAETTAATGS